MNILVVTGIFPPDYGGPATYVPAIAASLAKTHTIIAVVTLSERNYDDREFSFPVVRIDRHFNQLLRVLRTIWTVFRFARKADVVYLNGLVFEGVVACKLFSRKPLVIKVVGDLIWERARRYGITTCTLDEFQHSHCSVYWRCLRWLQSWYLKKADRVITPSRYLANIVAGWGISRERLCVIYNAVDVSNHPGTIKKASTDLVTVARLVPWKGVAELIGLCAARGWTLKIVGDGPLRKKLVALVEHLHADHLVHFTGHVPASSVADEIRTGRVFVLNSTYEGLPHVVLEAKAAGVPVVATSTGGTPETITDGVDGRLVPAGDIDALAAALQKLLEDSESQRLMADEGLRQVKRQFAFAEMLRHTERALAEVWVASH